VLVDREVEVVAELDFRLAVDTVGRFEVGGAAEAEGPLVVFGTFRDGDDDPGLIESQADFISDNLVELAEPG